MSARPISVTQASDALRQARAFMSEASGPADSKQEQERLTSTMHALERASRLAEVAGELGELRSAPDGSEDARALELCAQAMRNALVIADEVGAVPRDQESSAAGASIASIEPTMAQLESSAKTLRELQKAHRNAILSSVAGGAVSADDAIARVETIRRLEAIARHAWRCAAHLAQ